MTTQLKLLGVCRFDGPGIAVEVSVASGRYEVRQRSSNISRLASHLGQLMSSSVMLRCQVFCKFRTRLCLAGCRLCVTICFLPVFCVYLILLTVQLCLSGGHCGGAAAADGAALGTQRLAAAA